MESQSLHAERLYHRDGEFYFPTFIFIHVSKNVTINLFILKWYHDMGYKTGERQIFWVVPLLETWQYRKNISGIALTSLFFSCSKLLSLHSACNSSLCKRCVFKDCNLWLAFLFASGKKDSFLLLSAPAGWSSAMCCKALSLCSSCFSSPCNVLWRNCCLFPKQNFSNFSERKSNKRKRQCIRHKADTQAICAQLIFQDSLLGYED